MRSNEYRVNFMENRKKVKRRRINWWKVLQEQDDPELCRLYVRLQKRLYRGRPLSFKRCSYYALKSYYSTTTIDELCEKLGL